jgi:hypothetical protein
MSERTARVLMLLPWLSLPLVAVVYLLWWDSVPERLAVHFDWEGTPNGWMTRGQSLAFDVVILLFVLVTSSFKLYRRGPSQAPGQLALFNVVILFLTAVCLGILKYNVTGSLF